MNYHFNVAGPNENVVRLGIGAVCELAENAGANQIGLLVPVFSVLDGVIRTALGGNIRALKTGNHRMQINFGGNEYWLTAMSNRTIPHQFDGPILAAFTRPADTVALGAMNGVTDVVFVPHSAAEAATFAADCESQELVVPED